MPETHGDVFGRDVAKFNDRLGGGERELSIIRDIPICRCVEDKWTGAPFEWPTHRVADRSGEQATSNSIAK
jgi:hypothetical protein